MSEETDYWRVQAQDAVTELHAAEARMADVMRAGDLEHARMAAMIEACEAVAQFVESYDRDSTVARLLPTFYANLRVYGKNARAAVSACRAQADAIVSELEAGRAVVAAVTAYFNKRGAAHAERAGNEDIAEMAEALAEYGAAKKAREE
jgi:hypothetical protein